MMAEFSERKSGLVVPLEEQPVRKLFIQHDLIEEQLPSYLKYINDKGAFLESVWRAGPSQHGLGGFRWCVAYMHHEQLDTEIYC
jgi:hypothetical protein